jgi:hypothetical protein
VSHSGPLSNDMMCNDRRCGAPIVFGYKPEHVERICIDVLGRCRHQATGLTNRPYVDKDVRAAQIKKALGASAGGW